MQNTDKNKELVKAQQKREEILREMVRKENDPRRYDSQIATLRSEKAGQSDTAEKRTIERKLERVQEKRKQLEEKQYTLFKKYRRADARVDRLETPSYKWDDRKVLVENLRTAGKHPPSDVGYDAHHVVPLKENDSQGYFEKSREILRRDGVDLNSHDNGVWLPSNRNLDHTGRRVNENGNSMHQTLHSKESRNAYAKELYTTLEKQPPGEARKGLDEMTARLNVEGARIEKSRQPSKKAPMKRSETGSAHSGQGVKQRREQLIRRKGAANDIAVRNGRGRKVRKRSGPKL